VVDRPCGPNVSRLSAGSSAGPRVLPGDQAPHGGPPRPARRAPDAGARRGGGDRCGPTAERARRRATVPGGPERSGRARTTSAPGVSATSRLESGVQPRARITERSASRPRRSTATTRYTAAGLGRLASTATGNGRCTRGSPRPRERRPAAAAGGLLSTTGAIGSRRGGAGSGPDALRAVPQRRRPDPRPGPPAALSRVRGHLQVSLAGARRARPRPWPGSAMTEGKRAWSAC
jgi:hypothetical protein